MLIIVVILGIISILLFISFIILYNCASTWCIPPFFIGFIGIIVSATLSVKGVDKIEVTKPLSIKKEVNILANTITYKCDNFVQTFNTIEMLNADTNKLIIVTEYNIFKFIISKEIKENN